MTFSQFLEELENQPTEFNQLMQDLKAKYPGVELFAWEKDDRIYLSEIRVPKVSRGQGIGTNVILALQVYAQRVDKPIVLSPEPEKGKKGALDRFYRGLGFVHNRGRHRDYRLSTFGGPTMIWRPK